MSAPFALLHPRHLVSLQGPDRVRFLNGQMSNDCRKVQPGTQIPACILNAKGKLQFTLHVNVTPDALLCDAPVHSDGPTLFERLDRYLIADQVELSDLSDRQILLHFPDQPEPSSSFPSEAVSFRSKRLGTAGTDVWIPQTALKDWTDRPERLSEPQIAERRILHGIPDWGHELDEDTLPAEAGLDRTHIDFHKGCYIGQEVVSRIKSVGRVNRSLVRIESNHLLFPGASLQSAGRDCGHITSVAAESNGIWHALAFVHRSADHAQLTCENNSVAVVKHFVEPSI